MGSARRSITTKGKHEADAFFKGLFETALAPDEIITKVSFPLAKKAGYEKFRNQASRFALVGVFVSKRGSEIRVAVTGAGSNGVFRVPSFEEALKKRFSPKSLEGLTIPADGMNSRHPWQRRIPRPPGGRDGAPGGDARERDAGGEDVGLSAVVRRGVSRPYLRHARPCAGHPRLLDMASTTWMAGTSPAMTE